MILGVMCSVVPVSVVRMLHAHNLKVIMHSPGSTATAEMAAAQLGVELGQIANTLLWITLRSMLPLLLVVSGAKKVSPGKVKRIVGSKIRMATPAEIAQHLESRPGAVCPFIAQSIPIFIDTSLQLYPYIYPAAGTDCSSVKVSYQQLVEMCNAQGADFVQ